MKPAIVLAVFIALAGAAFALTPAEKVKPYIGEPSPTRQWNDPDTRPLKSGLRQAVEGRLKWLGIEL